MKLQIDSIDMYFDKYSQQFDCILEKTKFGKKYTYKDEHSQVSIYVLNTNKVRIFREGNINSKQYFDLEQETKFLYNTNYLKTYLTLLTKELIIEDNTLSLIYELYGENKNLINSIKMIIREG